MPNLPAHIELAAIVAERLGPSALDGNLGHFLLGSTSPDIRAITKANRQDYHFAPLSFESIGAGVDGMLNAHPELRDASGRGGPTGAFIAGYITHLIYDETWIFEMFRPCFGNSGVFADEMEGKVLDRALQLDLDRQAQPKVAASLPALAGASGSIDVQFMPAEELAQWRDWVVEFVGRGFSWDRLDFMARRAAAGGDPQLFLKIADDFLDGLPGSIEELSRLIGPGRVARFKAGAIEKATTWVEEYLS